MDAMATSRSTLIQKNLLGLIVAAAMVGGATTAGEVTMAGEITMVGGVTVSNSLAAVDKGADDANGLGGKGGIELCQTDRRDPRTLKMMKAMTGPKKKLQTMMLLLAIAMEVEVGAGEVEESVDMNSGPMTSLGKASVVVRHLKIAQSCSMISPS